MSVKLMAMVFDDYPGPPLEKLTALAVADHADHDGGRIWPTIAALAAKTGNSERTIQRHLQSMQDRGWLELVRASSGRGSVNEYRMPIERIKGVTVTPFSDPERVTPASPFSEKKGDNGDTKGCQPRHERVTTATNIVCESPTTRQEPSTTAASNSKNDFPENFHNDFETTWRSYPHRAGSNPKRRAFKAWQARRREGTSATEMHSGTLRYAEFCKQTGKLHTEYIMQAATFFGPDKRFAEPWTLPSTTGGTHATRQPVDNSAIGQIRAANERARQREAAERGGDSPAVGAHGDDLRPPLEGEFRFDR